MIIWIIVGIIICIAYLGATSNEEKRCSKCGRKLDGEDYNGLCINCYMRWQRQLGKKVYEDREKEKKSLNNINIIHQNLKENIINNNYILYLYDCLLKIKISNLRLDLKSEYNTAHKLMKHILKEAILTLNEKENYNINDIIELFRNPYFFNSIFIECIECKQGYNCYEVKNFTDGFIVNFLDTTIKSEFFEGVFAEMFVSYINGTEPINLDEKNIYTILKRDEEHFYSENEYMKNLISNLCIFYAYSCFLLYSQKFSENVKLLKDNEELYTMINNVTKKSDINYSIEKLYPIYKMDYITTFNEILSKGGFFNVISLANISETEHKYIDAVIKEEMHLGQINVKNIELKEFIEYINVEKLYEEIEKGKLYKKIMICSCILNFLKWNLDFDEVLDFISNSAQIYDMICDKYEKIQAKKDKERFLRGDFSKEEEIQKQELEYLNIESGYEFEEYVAKLYGKLGYKVEVTKKSRDQGADIIAYKDNVKYVIQAKFYSNPVGNKAVQEVVAAIGMYKANKGIVVTNSNFTPSAIELARANQIELVDGNEIEILKNTILESLT